MTTKDQPLVKTARKRLQRDVEQFRRRSGEALQLLPAFRQQLRFTGGKHAEMMTAHLLGAISMLRLPMRRGRVEPHAIKRRPKNHELLTVPRHLARAAILRARPSLK